VVGARPITEVEVMEAKGNMIKGMPRQFQTVGGVAGQVSDIFEYELPLDEWSASLERLAAITPEQATKAARDHLDAGVEPGRGAVSGRRPRAGERVALRHDSRGYSTS
jgi:predicted Zn-dependent peptidase